MGVSYSEGKETPGRIIVFLKIGLYLKQIIHTCHIKAVRHRKTPAAIKYGSSPFNNGFSIFIK